MVDPDTPGGAYALLERRTTVAMAGCLAILAALGWAITAQQASEMGSLQIVAASMAMSLSAPVFMAIWLAMMVAMMFPAVAPMVLAHRMVTRHRGESVVSSLGFVTGYIVVWTAIGLVPMALLLVFRAGAQAALGGNIVVAGGGAVIVSGAYQFTAWKTTCQRACRSPINFITTHDFGRGTGGALRAGLSQGGYCVGCCWALMTVLLVVGLMNLAWMAGLTLIFLLEKNWSRGVQLTRVVGVALVLMGVAIAIDPALLERLSGVPLVHLSMGDHR